MLMSTFRLQSLFRFLVRNWTTILAAIAVSGYVLGYELHLFQAHQEFFKFLGANAVIWTLVELKASLRAHTPTHRYANMRAARAHIMERLKHATSRRRETTITIVGGRIRTISDMLRELVLLIQEGSIAAQNTHVTVYCLHPDYLIEALDARHFTSPGHNADRFVGYGDIIRRFAAEVDAYNLLPDLTGRNVTFDVVLYRSIPYFYCFLIDRADLFWGFFTWNAATEDFDGPPNPCFYYSSNAEHYDDFYSWISNRTTFLQLTAR